MDKELFDTTPKEFPKGFFENKPCYDLTEADWIIAQAEIKRLSRFRINGNSDDRK